MAKKKQISPEDNWGDVMSELRDMRAQGADTKELFVHWSYKDLTPLFTNPFKQAKYLRRLASKNAKKREKALKTAEEFRDAMREVFLYIFEDTLSDEQRDELVAMCEMTANGMLSSLIGGAHLDVQVGVTIRGRNGYMSKLIEG